MPRCFHVTSSDNRSSIAQYGLDWKRMGDVRGVAGSSRPEIDGVFLCRDEFEADFFCDFEANNCTVDVWAVDGIAEAELVDSPQGFVFVARPIPADALTLWRKDFRSEPHQRVRSTDAAYQSTLTITLDDGHVLRDEAAREWMQQQRPGDR